MSTYYDLCTACKLSLVLRVAVEMGFKKSKLTEQRMVEGEAVERSTWALVLETQVQISARRRGLEVQWERGKIKNFSSTCGNPFKGLRFADPYSKSLPLRTALKRVYQRKQSVIDKLQRQNTIRDLLLATNSLRNDHSTRTACCEQQSEPRRADWLTMDDILRISPYWFVRSVAWESWESLDLSFAFLSRTLALFYSPLTWPRRY